VDAVTYQANLYKMVSFHPPQQNIASFLNDASIGVLTSDEEGFPLALLEYMAAGLPVVMTDVGACRMIVEAATCGLVVPPRNPTAFARAVALLLESPDTAKKMGENGRRYVLEYHSAARMTKNVLNFYHTILQNDDE
jgi:glycosyltransferase involved in cell wall biosynthesis